MEPTPPVTGPESIVLQLVTPDGKAPSQPRRREPLTIGLPIARGACRAENHITVRMPDGTPLPSQVRVTDRWPDGSIRWAVLDTQADVPTSSPQIVVDIGAPASPAQHHAIRVTEDAASIIVDTGSTEFTIARSGQQLFTHVRVAGRESIDCQLTGFRLQDGSGANSPIVIQAATVEAQGPVRTVVRVEGIAQLQSDERASVRMTCRLHFFLGSAAVRMAVTLLNPRRAVHPGGFWDLGDAGSIHIRDFSFALAMRGAAGITGTCSSEADTGFRRFSSSFELYQDSSGGDHFRSSNHVDATGNVPIVFRGYREHRDGDERAGDRATPVVTLTDGTTSIACAMQYFWQNFPKAIEATGSTITMRLFPKQSSGPHELQGGEQKTHVFVAAFGADSISEEALEWVRRPSTAIASPDYYCSTAAIPYLSPRRDDRNQDYLTLVDAAIEGPDTFAHKREVVDQYGWRHFGEIYGDHEAVRRTEAAPLVSHYNNQYDPVAGFTYQFLRSGDIRWLTQMHELAAHVVDIDIYHTDQDKPAYNHGLFWHTVHYIDADKATHRSYPRAAAALTGGGGPGCEHLYTTGLMIHYFMTGDLESRESVINMARLVIDVDDGSKTVLRWLSRAHTGWASASGSFAYHGPGRGPGNALNTLVDAHRLTQTPEFLAKAEELIRRCVHPEQDVAALNLLDAERRWYYTVFLQALGKYLDYKAERNELDEMYAYGRASLLHYARWMAAHEYPILDKPEILEFPTETWSAQDMRKSEVFKYAAKHADGDERARFLERSDYFFRESTGRLMNMPTRSLARPVVLLLSYGFMHAWVQRHPSFTAPAGVTTSRFGRPTTFVPQRVLAKRRAVAVAAAGVIGLLGGLSFLVLG